MSKRYPFTTEKQYCPDCGHQLGEAFTLGGGEWLECYVCREQNWLDHMLKYNSDYPHKRGFSEMKINQTRKDLIGTMKMLPKRNQ